ncbi:MAG: hypothetical protein HZB38_17215 [Planctomycetes bacterium]|nr:hypothetical protein [Planctomycetota bacterium]
MSTIEISQPVAAGSAWPSRLRVAAIIAVVTLGLQWLSGYSVLGRGYQRPLVLVGQVGLIPSLGAIALLIGGAVLAGATSRCGRCRDALLVIGWSLGIWSCGGSSMDQWLSLQQPAPGAPTGAPYWALLPDYALLAGCMAVSLVAVRAVSKRTNSGPKPAKSTIADGLKAMLVCVAVAGVVLLVCAGPRSEWTRQRQIFFAVAAAFWLGVFAARQLTHVERAIWYLPAPLIVGVVGAIYAAMRPGLPIPYDQINNIPAWGLVRPLPAEMIGVGLIAVLWSLKPTGAQPAGAAS